MQKNLTIILVILLYSCVGDSPITPHLSIDYHTDDQQFIDELANSNQITNTETIIDRITTVEEVDSVNISYYRIKKLYLSNMGLSVLPESIGKLDSLEVLNIDANELTSIPHQICNAEQINYDSLQVENNKLCTPNIPTCININFAFQDCYFTYHEEDVQFLSELVQKNSVAATMIWFGENYDSLYQEIFSLTTWEIFVDEDSLKNRIVKLDLNDLGISELPETSIGFIKKLRSLELENNFISKLPDPITTLENLEILQVYNNLLTEIPYFIGNLTSLVELYINNNQIKDLRETISDLNNLKILYAQNNDLGSGPGLPDSFCLIINNLDEVLLGCNNLDSTDYLDSNCEYYLGDQNCDDGGDE